MFSLAISGVCLSVDHQFSVPKTESVSYSGRCRDAYGLSPLDMLFPCSFVCGCLVVAVHLWNDFLVFLAAEVTRRLSRMPGR